MLSLVIPVFRNEESLSDLLGALDGIAERIGEELEVVFVVDGSPDRSAKLLAERLGTRRFRSQLVLLSRNFGSFSAVRAGLALASGERFAVMAADLQEPPELILEFASRLRGGEWDVVVGTRVGRLDPLGQRLSATIFWRLYRALVQPAMPRGGIDVFACALAPRDALLRLEERNTSLVGLLVWMGFRRSEVPYVRQARAHGRSAWSLRKRVRYLADSVFAFSDLPIRFLTLTGALGIFLSLSLGTIVLVAKALGEISVPGYTPTVLTVVFFGGLNSLGLGLLGEYLWRTFENSKRRPDYLVADRRRFEGGVDHESR